jgi:hypothetical protein
VVRELAVQAVDEDDLAAGQAAPAPPAVEGEEEPDPGDRGTEEDDGEENEQQSAQRRTPLSRYDSAPGGGPPGDAPRGNLPPGTAVAKLRDRYDVRWTRGGSTFQTQSYLKYEAARPHPLY